MGDITDVIPNSVNPTVSRNVTALSLVAGMACKPIAEKVLSRYIGNGTFYSGAIKIGLAVAAHKFVPGAAGEIAAIAVGSDGGEDLLLSVRGKMGGGNNQESGVKF